MVAGTYYQLNMIFGPQDPNGQGGSNGGNEQIVVFSGNITDY